MEAPTPSPSHFSAAVAPRIHVVDALRGFALIGILLVHISMFFYAGFPAKALHPVMNEGIANQIVGGFNQILIEGKFYTIFSFLFGLSFAIQMVRAKEKGQTFVGRFIWRLVILGLIGLAHQLHWRGDILMIYAVLGFILLLFRYASNQLVLIVGFLLVVNVPGQLQNAYNTYLVASQPEPQQQGPPETLVAEAEKYYQLLKQGSYGAIAQANLAEMKAKADFQLWSGRVFITLGCFLLGLYAGRRKLFHHLAENRLFFKQLLKYSGFSILALIAAALIMFALFQGQQNPPAPLMSLLFMLYYVASATFTAFYIAGVTLLLQRSSWQGIQRSLAAVGKMALTNYVLQSVMGTLIFYGYGLNLLGQMPAYFAFLLTFPLFGLQIVFSSWWLKHFQYGPLEWLWRSLTYLRIQPLKTREMVVH